MRELLEDIPELYPYTLKAVDPDTLARFALGCSHLTGKVRVWYEESFVDPKSLLCLMGLGLAMNDTIEVYIENESDKPHIDGLYKQTLGKEE